jgi:hypothetical protein
MVAKRLLVKMAKVSIVTSLGLNIEEEEQRQQEQG